MKTRSRLAGPPGVPALGYATVSSEEALDGPEVDSQRLAIEGVCERLNLRLVEVVSDRRPDGADPNGQPGLLRALERIDAGEASCLVVSELERLTRQTAELETVLSRLDEREARLVAIDIGLDSASETGRMATRPDVAVAAPVAPQPEEVVAPEPVEVAQPEPELEPEPLAEAKPEASAPAWTEPPAAPVARASVLALGYASTPADGEAGGRDLEGQAKTVERACARLGLEVVEIVREREPRDAKSLDRPGLSFLIERVAAGDASCVVVSGLQHLSRSVAELGTIVKWLERNEVRLVVEDLELDTAKPGGRMTARTLASVASWEHDRLSERTRKGLAAARARRRSAGGDAAPDWTAIRKRIATMRADGMTLQAIADVLNQEGIPTQRGGSEWRPSSVQTAAGYKRRTRSKTLGDLPKVERPRP